MQTKLEYTYQHCVCCVKHTCISPFLEISIVHGLPTFQLAAYSLMSLDSRCVGRNRTTGMNRDSGGSCHGATRPHPSDAKIRDPIRYARKPCGAASSLGSCCLGRRSMKVQKFVAGYPLPYPLGTRAPLLTLHLRVMLPTVNTIVCRAGRYLGLNA